MIRETSTSQTESKTPPQSRDAWERAGWLWSALFFVGLFLGIVPALSDETLPNNLRLWAIGLTVLMALWHVGMYLLSRRIADGELEPEQFLDPEIPTPELKKSLLRIKGIGNYAAATMLMLLGRYDELPVDSVFRQFVSQKYFGGAPMSDKDGAAIYDDWGKWKYLAYWFDVWEGTTENI